MVISMMTGRHGLINLNIINDSMFEGCRTSKNSFLFHKVVAMFDSADGEKNHSFDSSVNSSKKVRFHCNKDTQLFGCEVKFFSHDFI